MSNIIFAQQNAHIWADFEHYSYDNCLLMENTKSQINVIFMGDSITERWMKLHSVFFEDNGYVCRGISGQTSYQFLLRFREDVIKLRPAIVVINAATNDIAENTGPYNEDYTFGNIVSMVELAQVNNITVVLTSVLPALGFEWNPGVSDVVLKIERLNKRLKSYAEEKNIEFIDYYSHLEEEGGMKIEFADDGVHPTIKGYDVMECLIKPILDKMQQD